jgi:hypothetical protein
MLGIGQKLGKSMGVEILAYCTVQLPRPMSGTKGQSYKVESESQRAVAKPEQKDIIDAIQYEGSGSNNVDYTVRNRTSATSK